MDPEIGKARRFMQEKILQFLAQRQPQTAEIPQRRIFDIVKRLEEGLYRTATTQEEYLNLETLESRLHVIIKRPQMTSNNPQRSQYSNSSIPLGTMIPTPGMPQHGNSNMISSTDNSTVTPSTGNTISSSSGNNTYMLPTENGSSDGMHAVSNGSLSNGYQQGTNVDRVVEINDVQDDTKDQDDILESEFDLLVHASQCRSALCQYPNCRKVKGLFRHGNQCKVRASAGCLLCKKIWYLLQLHARACKETLCHVPRCRDLREHLRRLQQQADSRRRAAVMEMMRQRAAEVAGNSG